MPRKKRDWPDHELANYRIALKKYKGGGYSKRLWDTVIGNAMRLAEAIDRIDRNRG